jgi:hypothetical protein
MRKSGADLTNNMKGFPSKVPIGPAEPQPQGKATRLIGLKEIRMRGDLFAPELLHHRVHLLWFIVIAVRKHISELARIELPPAGLTGIWAEGSPRKLVSDALRRSLELVSLNRCRNFASPVTSRPV